MSLQYWFMLPIGIVIATTAMASGVGGATFFSLLFILALGLPPEVAIATGLITEVFGFASGLYAYARKGLIDYWLGTNLLVVTIPMALVGTWVAGRVDPDILKVVLGIGLFAVAFSFLGRRSTRMSSGWMRLSSRSTVASGPRPAWLQPRAKRFATRSAIEPKDASSAVWGDCS